jgi:hypothetical protein
MCDYDADPVAAYKETWRKARKDHWCCACRETIPRGHLYHYCSFVFDGRGESLKHCARCWEIYLFISDAQDDPRASVNLELNCGMSWKDAFEEDPPEEVAALAFMTPEEGQKLAERYINLRDES